MNRNIEDFSTIYNGDKFTAFLSAETLAIVLRAELVVPWAMSGLIQGTKASIASMVKALANAIFARDNRNEFLFSREILFK